MDSPAPRPLVLVADDAPMVRALVCQVLEAAGFETAMVEDGQGLVALAGRRPPHAIAPDRLAEVVRHAVDRRPGRPR